MCLLGSLCIEALRLALRYLCFCVYVAFLSMSSMEVMGLMFGCVFIYVCICICIVVFSYHPCLCLCVCIDSSNKGLPKGLYIVYARLCVNFTHVHVCFCLPPY